PTGYPLGPHAGTTSASPEIRRAHHPAPRRDGAGSRTPPSPGDRAIDPVRADRRDGGVRGGARACPPADLRGSRRRRERVPRAPGRGGGRESRYPPPAPELDDLRGG